LLVDEVDGLTIIELLIVMVILTILSGIVVAVYPSITDTGKQSTTVSNLRAIASTMSIYHMDHNRYPDANSIDDLRAVLEPTYIERLPRLDGWGQEFFINSNATTYTIGSGGKGWDGSDMLTSEPVGATVSPTSDIILTDGSFTQFPVNYLSD